MYKYYNQASTQPIVRPNHALIPPELVVLFMLPKLRTLLVAMLLELRKLSHDGAVRMGNELRMEKSDVEPAASLDRDLWLVARSDIVDCIAWLG